MLLKICLVIAILAGAGVIVVGHLKVRPHIEGIIAETESEKTAKKKALTELDTTKKNLNKANDELAKTKTALTDTQTQLAAVTKQVETEQKRANSLKENLDALQEKYTESQQKLARWADIGLDPVQVKEVIASQKQLLKDNQALDVEKKFFAKKLKDAEAELKVLRNPDEEPQMRTGLKGRVLVVDPKWSFVLLDVGEKDGVVKHGVFMVSRNSKLV